MTVRGGGVSKADHLWHEALHTHVANEQLVYVFLQYSPTYNRTVALAGVKAALQSNDVVSYALWELIGQDDLLVQAWIPRSMRLSTFENALQGSAHPGSSIVSTAVSVEEFIEHWMWTHQDGVNWTAAVHDVDERHFVEVNSSATVPAAAIRRYQNAGYLYKVRPAKTIKLFIRVSTFNRPASVHSEGELNDRIRQALADCPELTSPVLMRVLGGGCAFLLSGRVKPVDFESIAERLQPALHTHGLLDVFAARTTTQISALRGPVDRREQLRSFAQVPDERLSDEDLFARLSRPESALLEFKASAFTDLNHAVGRSTTKRSRDEQVEEIAKAVAGFANARGGTVVIGVAERKRFTVEELRLADYRAQEHGDNIVIGVDREFPQGGWDAYVNQLGAKLRAHLDPNASGAFRIRDLDVDGLTLCVITVFRGTRWYWVKQKGFDHRGKPATVKFFYGRHEASTTPLDGSEADAYKQANPRADKPGQMPPDA